MPPKQERETRVLDALNNLVKQLVPRLEDEDVDDYDERKESAYELARSILKSGTAPAVIADCEYFQQ
jgi:hypothetical protein